MAEGENSEEKPGFFLHETVFEELGQSYNLETGNIDQNNDAVSFFFKSTIYNKRNKSNGGHITYTTAEIMEASKRNSYAEKHDMIELGADTAKIIMESSHSTIVRNLVKAANKGLTEVSGIVYIVATDAGKRKHMERIISKHQYERIEVIDLEKACEKLEEIDGIV